MELVPIKARTAAENLSLHIRDEILAGKYQPASQLLEISLSEKYGVSRNTLREAFRLLKSDGLLTHYPNRGVFVRKFTSADVEDLYAFRRLLELAALEEVFRSTTATNQCIAHMRLACAKASEGLAVGDWNTVAIANNDFHMAIFHATGVERMVRVAQTIMVQCRLMFMACADDIHRPFVAENETLLQLIQSGKKAEASHMLATYLLQSQTMMMQLMSTE